MALKTGSLEHWLSVEYILVGDVHPNPKNARKHSPKQIGKLARIIADIGWSTPMVVDERNMVLCGHGRLAAAKQLGLEKVPCVRVSHLDASKKKALAIADNAMSDASSFDDAKLRELLIELTELDFDVSLTGLEIGKIDVLIAGGEDGQVADPVDAFELPGAMAPAVSRPGDLWCLGKSRLYCGSALDEVAYARVLDGDKAAMVFTDPPYNVPIAGHVSGLGRHRHAEFAMASGEMSADEYRTFLAQTMKLMIAHSIDGAIHDLCIDWRHIGTMLDAAHGNYSDFKNLCVWVKSNGGMGSLYRSRHELVAVFKAGSAPHINNVDLGANGRWRTNVWEYAGANAFGATRDQDLADHATVKPVALVADAIRDCSNLGDLVLDPFLGSGTTLLAAERTRRRGAGIEIEPRFVDVAIGRWQQLTGKAATLADDGRTFAEIAAARAERDEAASEDKI